MRKSKRLALAVSAVVAAGAAAVGVATAVSAAPEKEIKKEPEKAGGRAYADTWGVIGRNTTGSPNAVLRNGPFGRVDSARSAATQPPPYGDGSLGLIVDDGEKIAFGDETRFAHVRLSALRRLEYWTFTGTDDITGVTPPGLALEVDPRKGTATYSSLVFLPDNATAPSSPARSANVWQRWNAVVAGSAWFATGPTGTLINCTLAHPCTFDALKTALPDARITFSLGFTKGTDNAFVGAVDGLRVNDTVYDFEWNGVRRRT